MSISEHAHKQPSVRRSSFWAPFDGQWPSCGNKEQLLSPCFFLEWLKNRIYPTVEHFEMFSAHINRCSLRPVNSHLPHLCCVSILDGLAAAQLKLSNVWWFNKNKIFSLFPPKMSDYAEMLLWHIIHERGCSTEPHRRCAQSSPFSKHVMRVHVICVVFLFPFFFFVIILHSDF